MSGDLKPWGWGTEHTAYDGERVLTFFEHEADARAFVCEDASGKCFPLYAARPAAAETIAYVELPDELRLPLRSLQADCEYLFGRVATDGNVASAMAESVRTRLAEIEAAVRSALVSAPSREEVRREALEGVVAEIAAERRRQVEAEGWTPEHDDGHDKGEMAAAAAAYAFSAFTETSYRAFAADPVGFWPWDAKWWKPKDARRDLVRAAALIVAEIERLDRAAIRRLAAGEASE